MSSPVPGTRAPARGPRSARRPRSRLRVVPTGSARPGGRSFVLLLVLVLGGGLVGLLVLNTAMQRSAFRLEELQTQADDLAVRQQVLDLQVDRLQSPDTVAQRARSLGMVPAPGLGYLRLSDGAVLGDPQPAVATAPPPMPADTAAVVDPPPPTPAEQPERGQQQGQQQGRQQARQQARQPDGGAR